MSAREKLSAAQGRKPSQEVSKPSTCSQSSLTSWSLTNVSLENIAKIDFFNLLGLETCKDSGLKKMEI
jgi:hypothetical protein